MHTLFQDVPQNIIDNILSQSVEGHPLPAGEELFTRFDSTNFIYIIESGYMTLRYPSRLLESPTYFLAWRGPGSVLGEVDMLQVRERNPIIKATEDCLLTEIHIPVFEQEAQNCPILYKNLARVVNDKVMDHAKRSEVIQMQSSKRVARTLLILAQDRGYRSTSNNYIKGKITNEDLSGYVGLGVGAVQNAFGELSSLGIINRFRDKGDWIIEVLDVKKLADFTLPKIR